MLIAYLPLLICIIGLVVWQIPNRFSKAGEHAFWTGLLVTLFSVAHHTVKLF